MAACSSGVSEACLYFMSCAQLLPFLYPSFLFSFFRDSGSTRVPLKVPDTITKWETEAFCLSSKGFGLAPPVSMMVFQPFFLELSLPYSIIRGEYFELKATVFNYLSKCIMVWVYLLIRIEKILVFAQCVLMIFFGRLK